MKSPSSHSHAHSSSHSGSHHSSSHTHSSSHASPAHVVGGSHVDPLDSLEQHEHLHLTDSAVSVVVALGDCVPNVLVIVGRGHAHGQAEISVGEEELLSFELAGHVHVVLHEDSVDVVLEHLVVDVGVPSSRVVDHVEAVHSLVVHAVVAEAVEAHTSAHTSADESAASVVSAVHDMLTIINQHIHEPLNLRLRRKCQENIFLEDGPFLSCQKWLKLSLSPSKRQVFI